MTLEQAVERTLDHLGYTRDFGRRERGDVILRSVLTMLEHAGVVTFDEPPQPRTVWLKARQVPHLRAHTLTPEKVQVDVDQVITAMRGAGYKVERT